MNLIDKYNFKMNLIQPRGPKSEFKADEHNAKLM